MMLLEDIPALVRREILTYSFPLFLTTTSRAHRNNEDYWKAIPGALAGTLISPFITAKRKLQISAVLYFLQILVRPAYFAVLGFALQQSYSAPILLSRTDLVHSVIYMIEIVGLLFSELIEMPEFLRLLLAILSIFMSITCSPLSVDCQDPFDAMKLKIDTARLLNAEYRLYLARKDTKQENFGGFGLAPLDALYMLSSEKTVLLCCLFFSFGTSVAVAILIGLLFIFGYPWECLCLLLKVTHCENIVIRTAVSYVVYCAGAAITTTLNESRMASK